MPKYLNKEKNLFQESLDSFIYVDKSPLIEILNKCIKTKQKYFCLSRSRRFGKSVTAQMLCSYYSRGEDSSSQFDSLKIAKSTSYKKHLNQYNVIFINMSLEFNSARHDVNQMISSVTSSIVKELKEAYPQVVFNSPNKLYESLDDVFSDSKVPFVFIIDEWDRIMREKKEDAQSLKLYLEWLEGIFKDQSYIALAYMTGILPIKKYGNQSALNMFNEFSMTDPDNFAPFIGFTEREVQSLCNEFKMNFNQMLQWYDGYSFTDVLHVYNPNSVVKSISRKRFGSYWTKTENF